MAHIENFWENSLISNKTKRQLCCGCTACESICSKKAISMHADQEGFMYPKINQDLCIDCGLCLKVCPAINECTDNTPYVKSYGGYSTNKKIINSSASGGVATALSIATIEKGGVVFGVQFDQTYSNAEYVKITTIDDLWALCSSKYIQPSKSGIHSLVKKELLTGRKVLFIGCPCDVAGLKRYLRKEYDNLLTCELFCAGITSNKILRDYLTLREKQVHSKLTAFNVRSKDKGWFVQYIKEEYDNGKIFYKNHFGTYLGYAFLTFRRPSCYHCQYKQNVTNCDIKIGDFWGIKKTDPYWNTKGVSVILAKNLKGASAIEKLKDFKLYETSHIKATINNAGFMGVISEKAVNRRYKFEKYYISENKGLEIACRKTAPISFWIKYFIPTSFHTVLKKYIHSIIDK